MASDDDDLLTGPVPAPDAEMSASERAHARTFADLVDKTLAGHKPPVAMSADDRALLEVATVIRATRGNVELPAERRHAIVEDALRQAVGGAGASISTSTVGREPAAVPIERARARRWAPWLIAGSSALVAAAAVLVVWLRTPEAPGHGARITETAAEIPTRWKSRPADGLIGPIPRERVGDATTRIDTIFADRLEGYRERTLVPRAPLPGGAEVRP